MVKRLWPALLALLACGLIAAGCGDDDDEASDAATTTQEAADDSTDAATRGDTNDAVQAAVEACKQSVAATPGLSEGTITDLEALCEDAASGEVDDAQAAGVEVCKAIAEDTIPEDSARETAISACDDAPQ